LEEEIKIKIKIFRKIFSPNFEFFVNIIPVNNHTYVRIYKM
jgi:hypothetical protein